MEQFFLAFLDVHHKFQIKKNVLSTTFPLKKKATTVQSHEQTN